MVDNESLQSSAGAAAGISDGSGWSGNELDDAPIGRVHDEEYRPTELSEAETRKAALIFGIIILAFIGTGISLLYFAPENQSGGLLNCARIARDVERLACYDSAAQSASAPFKGGSPFSTYSSSELGNSG